MSELVVGKLLHTADALLVEESHIVAGISEQEVISTDAKPEEVNLLIGVVSIIIDVLDVGRCKRAVAAEIRELIEVRQTVEQSLVATTRETADSTVVAIVNGTIVLLDIRHQIVDKVLTKDIAAELHLRSTARSRSQQFRRIAIRQHDNHLFRQFIGNEVIKNIVHTSYLIIYLLGIGSAADEIENGIFLITILHIARRQIDNGIVRTTQTLGVVVNVLHASMRNGTDVVRQRAVGALHLQQAVLEAFIRKILRVLRIHDADAIDDVTIGIHVRSHRTKCYCPQACSGIAGHLLATGELYIDCHLTGRVVLVLESNHAILRYWLCVCTQCGTKE